MTHDTQICSVRVSDRAPILELMKRVICSDVTDNPDLQTLYIDNVIENFNGWMKQPTRSCHLKAIRDQQIVGVILVKEYWNLCSLFVIPDYQRQGIGKTLVLKAIAQCRTHSDEQAIYLNAAQNAIPFYKALGFIDRNSNKPQPPGIKPMRFLL